jgi:hypothetical protein
LRNAKPFRTRAAAILTKLPRGPYSTSLPSTPSFPPLRHPFLGFLFCPAVVLPPISQSSEVTAPSDLSLPAFSHRQPWWREHSQPCSTFPVSPFFASQLDPCLLPSSPQPSTSNEGFGRKRKRSAKACHGRPEVVVTFANGSQEVNWKLNSYKRARVEMNPIEGLLPSPRLRLKKWCGETSATPST